MLLYVKHVISFYFTSHNVTLHLFTYLLTLQYFYFTLLTDQIV